MLPRFDIAAVPTDPKVVKYLFQAAAQFKSIADGYCLAPDLSFPHISLCQFRAESDAVAVMLASKFSLGGIWLKNTGLYINKGTAEHEGKFWIGYGVARAPQLMDLQAEIADDLQNRLPEVYTKSRDGYFPHMPLARTSAPPSKLAAGFFSDTLIGNIEYALCLGHADENGQLVSLVDPNA
ncbi:MAG: hypothetical protein WDO70_09765 [Alphaproteobacteria bacterium]